MTSSKRILVVDDDEAIQSLLEVLLLRRGFSVDRAFDGDEALKKLRSHTYDLLLLDLMMPRINGFEVLQELRCVQPEMLKRTVVFTAASENTLRYFDERQVFRLIRKPFDINAIIGALTECLTAASGDDRKSAGRRNAAAIEPPGSRLNVVPMRRKVRW